MNEIQLARMLDQARSLVEEEKYLHAAQIYLRLINAEPGFILPYVELSSLYAELGRFTAIISLLKKAQSINPGNHEIIFLLGTYSLRMEEYDIALTYFSQLAGKKLPQVHFHMGVAYFHKNEMDRAEEHFRLTMKFDPAFPKINESLGELLIRREAYTEAIEYLKRGIVADPYSSVNHHLLGVAYGKKEEWKKGLNEFTLATDMDPTEAENWRMCGEALIHLKRYTEAEPYLRKSLELHPQSADALVSLSEVFLAGGDTKHARECIDKALKIDCHHLRAREARWKLGHRQQQDVKQS